MKCSCCGTENIEMARYCRKCGISLQNLIPPEVKQTFPLTKQFVFASYYSRIVAGFFDVLFIFMLNGMLPYLLKYLPLPSSFAHSEAFEGIFQVVFYSSYFVVFWTALGSTPGKRMLGIKVVNKFGQKINLMQAIARYFGYYLSAAVLLAGFWWMIRDPNRQTWHDKIAGTFVVRLLHK